MQVKDTEVRKYVFARSACQKTILQQSRKTYSEFCIAHVVLRKNVMYRSRKERDVCHQGPHAPSFEFLSIKYEIPKMIY